MLRVAVFVIEEAKDSCGARDRDRVGGITELDLHVGEVGQGSQVEAGT